MGAVQMNVRIDEETKRRGDEVFARAGFTPSQVVRAVWEYADAKGDVPDFMRAPDPDAFDAERRRRIALAEEGARLVDEFYREQGICFQGKRETLDCNALRDEVYDGMLEEMGL